MKGKVGFQPGNQEGKKLAGIPKGKNVLWNNIGENYMVVFTPKYHDMLLKLSQGIKISPEEKEFMTRFETQQEFFQPKLSRVDQTIGSPDGSPVTQSIEIKFV